MAEKIMNSIKVHGESVHVNYEHSYEKVLRQINSLNHRYASILVGSVALATMVIPGFFIFAGGYANPFILLVNILIIGGIFWYLRDFYVPKKGFLTVIGVKKEDPKSVKYLWHLGDATRAISEIPDPKIVVKDTPEKLEYPILVDIDMALRHMFAVGTTGSGKTTFSIYLLKQHLAIGGGGLVVDGKGDKDIYTSIVNTCIAYNREDDMYVINFNAPKESNKMNPLLKGDVDDISDLLGNLLESGGDNAFWAGRAISMMNAVMSCLIPLRNCNELYDPRLLIAEERTNHTQGKYRTPKEISGNVLDGSHVYQPILTFKVLAGFTDLTFMRDLYFRCQDRNKILNSEDYKGFGNDENGGGKIDLVRLATYLSSCGTTTATEEDREKEIPETGSKMHSNSNVMWNEALDLFMGTYGDIFDTDSPDLTMQDIVYNSRFLYVLLPATKKSPKTLAMLGKVILALVKQAVATLLGDKISGNIEERKASSAIRPIIPFLVILDEYGAFATPGFDNVLAQARSLRVSVLIEVQEIASLEKGGEIDKKRLLGNTAIKVILKVEDLATAEELAKMIGTEQKAYVRQSTEGETKKTYDVQERNIIESRELAQMKGGHGYIRFSGETTAMLAGFYEPPNARYIQEFNTFSELTTQEYSLINKLDEYMSEEGIFIKDNPLLKSSDKLYQKYMAAFNSRTLEIAKYQLKVQELNKKIQESNDFIRNDVTARNKIKSEINDNISKTIINIANNSRTIHDIRNNNKNQVA